MFLRGQLVLWVAGQGRRDLVVDLVEVGDVEGAAVVVDLLVVLVVDVVLDVVDVDVVVLDVESVLTI